MSSRGRERRVAWTVRVGVALLRLLAHTWRIRAIGKEPLDALRRRRQPVIFAFWHGQMLPLLWQHRDEGVYVLISEHRDGEIIARVAEALGYRTVRGSTTRGAGRALLGLARELEEGHDVAVTPDGPRGPARSFAPGALVASQRSGAPVIPIAAHARRAWRLGSWDRFLIPKPFARVIVAYGAPTPVSAPSAREAVEEAPRFQELLDAATARAGG